MRHFVLFFGVLAITTLLSLNSVSGQDEPIIGIEHTPPADARPGLQIYINAVLTNATSATILWRNATMDNYAVVPMTNISVNSGSGWTFAAYIPAQPSPTQVQYTINASRGQSWVTEEYFLTVDVPRVPGGISEEQQREWMMTIVAMLSMTASLTAMVYLYIGRKMRRMK